MGLFDGIGAGLVNGIGGLVGAKWSVEEQEKTNNLNAALARENMAAQAAANQANIESQERINAANVASAERMNAANIANQNAINQSNIDYQKKYNQQIFSREDNAISREVADLQRNGLNSLLAGNGLGAGGTAGTPVSQASATVGMAEQKAAQIQAVKNEMHYEKANAGLQIAQAITGMVDSIQKTQSMGLQEKSIIENARHNAAVEEETKKHNREQEYHEYEKYLSEHNLKVSEMQNLENERQWQHKNGTLIGQIANNWEQFDFILDKLGLKDTFYNGLNLFGKNAEKATTENYWSNKDSPNKSYVPDKKRNNGRWSDYESRGTYGHLNGKF